MSEAKNMKMSKRLLQRDTTSTKENHPYNQQTYLINAIRSPAYKRAEGNEYSEDAGEHSIAEETKSGHEVATDNNLTASDFQDAFCGDPLKSQIIRLDFSPQKGIDDNEEVLKKCQDFWEFLKEHTELHHLNAVPETCYPPKTETLVQPSQSGESIEHHGIKDKILIQEMTAIDWMNKKDIITNSIRPLEKRYCEDNRDYYCDAKVSEQKDKIKRRSRLASAKPQSSINISSRSGGRSKSVSSSHGLRSSQYNVEELVSQLKEWDLQHPRVMPADMSISMRHTKLKAEEAALIAGELTKPTWESRNEGIHERVSFEDTLWGFDLAGGVYYNTPLRITFVKPESRAEKAGIKPGDRLLKINGVDTSTLTIQEAHDIIVGSGIHIKLSVTSPDDFEDSYYYYEDPIVDDYEIEEQRRLEEEKARKRRVRAKVSHYWSLQWPWVSRRRLIYRESNCFMVTSKYEEQRRDKYPIRPSLRYFDDIILYNEDDEKEARSRQPSTRGPKTSAQSEDDGSEEFTDAELSANEEVDDSNIPTIVEKDEELSGDRTNNGDVQIEDITDVSNDITEYDAVVPENETENIDSVNDNTNDALHYDVSNENVSQDKAIEKYNSVPLSRSSSRPHLSVQRLMSNEGNVTAESTTNESDNVDVLNELMGKSDSTPRNEEDNILDSILSDEGQNLENTEFMNER